MNHVLKAVFALSLLVATQASAFEISFKRDSAHEKAWTNVLPTAYVATIGSGFCDAKTLEFDAKLYSRDAITFDIPLVKGNRVRISPRCVVQVAWIQLNLPRRDERGYDTAGVKLYPIIPKDWDSHWGVQPRELAQSEKILVRATTPILWESFLISRDPGQTYSSQLIMDLVDSN